MDRRKFLAASSLAATVPVIAGEAAGGADAGLEGSQFRPVNFTSDGLEFNPAEYATVLQRAGMNGLQADYYSNGGMIAALEEKFARALGKQAAMFVPTGTLANHLAARKLAGNNRRVLVQAESHFYNDSGDGAETLSGLNLVPLAVGSSTMTLEDVKSWVERAEHGRVPLKVGAISIESPVRRMDHAMADFAQMQAISEYARGKGIGLHLDGARMFNLPFHSGKSIREYAALFDTVYVSLWKHFNAASGAILAGSSEFIEGLYHTRRMFGGSLPHAWPLLAPATQYLETYEDDYARAWRAMEQFSTLLRASGRFGFRKLPMGTSRLFLAVKGAAPEVFVERLAKQNVLLPQHATETGEFALQVNASILRMPPAALAAIFIDASR